MTLNVGFDYSKDTPPGKDPDGFSALLNQHHALLWSKKLPNGRLFNLDGVRDKTGKFILYHKSILGEFHLSSDTVIHSLFYPEADNKSFSETIAYANSFPHEKIKNEISSEIIDFWRQEIGIACYTIFPALQINRQRTINQARGIDSKICDRFDLTLECIRRYYEAPKDISPLYQTLHRYNDFFSLFENFQGYIDFFLLQDLVNNDNSSVKFWLPFDNFQRSPLPQNSKEYQQYKENVCAFVKCRKHRISENINSK